MSRGFEGDEWKEGEDKEVGKETFKMGRKGKNGVRGGGRER